MKLQTFLGVLLILIGSAMLGYQRFSYNTREKVLEIGNVSATAEVTKNIDFPPILGWAALVSGGLILVLPHLRPKI